MKSLTTSMSVLYEKIFWNLQHRIRLLRARFRGTEIVCAACGQPIGCVVLGSRQGKIHLEWLDQYQVFVDFASQDEIQFRHVDQDECRRMGRPSQK
ncbi:MAG TPA: hypothetical protein VL981_06835 [Candidatus Methylacidiphilales bacterium]|nr:hypothetical protein [Candidatus Methylacidiphilales bacterium]